MNALVKKEIRLILPSWLAVLALALAVPWLSWQDPDNSFAWTPLFVFFGTILLAVESFGREFSLETFSSLLSQPMERRQIWRTKITILFSAAALIFAAYFISSEFLFQRALHVSVWNANPKILTAGFREAMLGCGAAMLIALAGGLWTTLLLRQISAAFWITFLIPLGFSMLLVFFLPAKLAANDHFVIPLLYSLAGIYIVLGFWLAHRLFHRAQDAAWTGGVISFSRWRYFEASSKNSISARRWKPISALLKKEFQLHSISLFCAGALLALHIGIFPVRAFYGNFHKNSTADVISEFFWIFWLVMPLIIGCMAVAEERKLGVTEGQFCQPVSRRFQFVIKFIPVMIFGILLGGVLPLLLEGIAAWAGVPNDYFKADSHAGNDLFSGLQLFFIGVISLSAAFALIGFLASTLAKNFLQALSIAIVIVVVGFLFVQSLTDRQFLTDGRLILFGVALGNPALPLALATLTALGLFPWLAYRNFRYFAESGRLWRRNIFGIAGALLFVFVSSAAIYNRAWEVFEPAELPHGPAKFSLSNPPKLNAGASAGIQVRLPDGRVWGDSFSEEIFWNDQPNRWKRFWWALVRPLPVSTGPQQFMSGSNWISTTAPLNVNVGEGENHVTGYLDTVGVQANGTLWISSEARPLVWTGANMVRYGDATNWRQVVRFRFWQFLLLKNDGTLWRWRAGTNRMDWNDWRTNWPTVRNFKPQQIGTNADWSDIFSPSWSSFARKTDGSVWWANYEGGTNDVKLDRATNWDQIVPQTFAESSGGQGYSRMAYVGKDGTLWICNQHLNARENELLGTGFLQVGTETNWRAVAINWNRMVALKADGSLWEWKLTTKPTADAVKIPPARFSVHQDWVGLATSWGGIISLAADGSLWFWPGPDYDGALLKSPKQPELLGNVFGKAD